MRASSIRASVSGAVNWCLYRYQEGRKKLRTTVQWVMSMPRITYQFSFDAFNDGSGAGGGVITGPRKFLMDVSEGLSKLYGRQVRQGQVFQIKSIEARIFNPGTVIQDENMHCSGKFIYCHPTSNRKKAWKNAFQAWMRNSKSLGITSQGRDFRVGLAEDYSTDVGMFGEGVKHNAWINADDDPLLLFGGNSNQGIFNAWNENMADDGRPRNASDGFGHWAQKDADSLLDELDFTAGDVNAFYTLGEACTVAQTAPFQVGFWSVFDSLDSQNGAGTTPIHRTEDIPAMCGLIGAYIDTSGVDDSESGTAQDIGIEITIDVESWSPIMKPRKKGGKK